MKMRKLGQSGLEVCPLMLGGNVFGWTADEAASFRILDRYVGEGGNFIDTADVYTRWIPGHQGGESETVLGRWFKKSGKRDQVILATKVGMDMGEDRKGLRPEHIRKSIDESLQRLQTDWVDLYQSHKDDPEVPVAETLGAYQQLIEAGKVRFIGASNYKADRLRAALELSQTQGLPRYETLQPQYSLVERADYEGNLEPVVQEFGMGVIPYFSLAAGFLTGKYRSKEDVEGKARAGVVGKYANDRGFAVVKVLDEVAKATSSTPAQVALAWLMAQPSVTSPIASATSETQLEDLLASVDLQLPKDAIARLDEVTKNPIAD